MFNESFIRLHNKFTRLPYRLIHISKAIKTHPYACIFPGRTKEELWISLWQKGKRRETKGSPSRD